MLRCEHRDLRAGERLGEVEALTKVTEGVLEALEVCLVLDALDDGLQLEDASQLHHGDDQQRCRWTWIRQERAIYLQDVDGEPAEISQRRVAGPEVVDGECDSERA